MSVGDEERILSELRSWADGERGVDLTWARLEIAFGFSRQTLNQKSRIKSAYLLAKDALGGGRVKSHEESEAEIDRLRNRVDLLEREVAEFGRRETLWRSRWQRIAFHIRRAGLQVHQVDKPAGEQVPSDRETAKILRPFDKDIPSTYQDDEEH